MYSKRNNNKKYANNYYNYTSEAYDYKSSYTYSPKTKNKKLKEKYVKAEENSQIFTFKFISTILLFVICIMSIIFIEALIIQRRFEIDDLNRQLKQITENNKNLETELAKTLDLDYVEYIAISELGMQKPTSNQIVKINIPKESYSQKSDNYNNDKILSGLKKLSNN